MDVYEKSQAATDTNDYIEVVKQLGRTIRRTIIFNSMVSSANPLSEERDHPVVQADELDKYKEPIRQLWSDINTYSIRGASGFIVGVFDSSNATKCGCRLVQFNNIVQAMIVSDDSDFILY